MSDLSTSINDFRVQSVTRHPSGWVNVRLVRSWGKRRMLWLGYHSSEHRFSENADYRWAVSTDPQLLSIAKEAALDA